MSVPETAVNENDRLVFGEDDIRMTGVSAVVLSIAKAATEQVFSDDFFRLCIPALNAGHVVASLRSCMIVSHFLPS